MFSHLQPAGMQKESGASIRNKNNLECAVRKKSLIEKIMSFLIYETGGSKVVEPSAKNRNASLKPEDQIASMYQDSCEESVPKYGKTRPMNLRETGIQGSKNLF